MRSSRLRHRIQATAAIVGTVAAVFGASRLIKAKAHPPPPPAPFTYSPPPYSPPIIPRTEPVVDPVAPAFNTAELVSAASDGDLQRMNAAYKEGMPLDGAMLAAAEEGKANALSWLIEHGANADDAAIVLAADKSPASLKVLFAKGAHEATLEAAADVGAINAVNRILAKGGAAANPNSLGDDGLSPMAHAVTNGDNNVVRAMIAHGAKVNETMLATAASEDNTTPLLDVLLTAHIDAKTISAAVGNAVGDEGAVLVKKLAPKGVAWSWRDESGDQHVPLVDAVERQDLPVVKAMIESGAPVSVTNEFGKTPLGAALASSAGTDDGVRVVRLLLARGADPNKRLDTGERPLTKAASAGDLRVVTMLVDHGASINAGLGSNDDETALEAAESGGHTDVARVLRSRGARRRPVQD